ncbi:AbfB domain-containing protein [Streptomyces sp. B6B3]|uniref:AbfB domain-containing protein n=1 Tax=Streptomyces sp. B6B3 TaxID=3153570 RepID=UPI00325ECA3A
MRQRPSSPTPGHPSRRGVVLGAAVLVAAPLRLLTAAPPAHAAAWVPGTPPLTTPWTSQVSPDNALPEHPRPQLVRPEWRNLNGVWEWSPAAAGEAPPTGRTLDRSVLVPYPVESALSGIAESHPRMWYKRAFSVPGEWAGRRVLLHLDAVDWRADVHVNGQKIGDHQGGYDRFSFDITDALRAGDNELIVGVLDLTNSGGQAVGKQSNDPEGIFYTPASGIWQTVWLEAVDSAHLTRLDITPDVANGRAQIVAHASGAAGATVQVTVRNDGEVVATASGSPGTALRVDVPDARLWSPDDPFLYDLDVSLVSGGQTRDIVTSYFGMRSIGKAMVDGVLRPVLNGKPVFQMGTLDQGYWPDGIYTAPTDEALRFDVQAHRDLGFNTIRKHVKIEPDRWYHWADRLGLMVLQDMPAMRTPAEPAAADRAQYELELRELVDQHRSFPSILEWIPFNEGWGQYDAGRIADLVKSWDPTRLVTAASGWHDPGNGDVVDSHIYVGPGHPTGPSDTRISALGEYGGLGLRTPDHEWSPGDGFGYEMVSDGQELTGRYIGLLVGVQQLQRNNGLSRAIYTEITDVENEVNGLYTYDRQVLKVDRARIAAAHADLLAGRRIGGQATVPVNTWQSLRVTTPGHTDRYLRHQDALAFTEPVTAASPQLLREDATWRLVPGLADPTCYSIESRNFPGEYLRHRNSRVERGRPDGTELFREDATWSAVPGLSGTGVSFRSYNLPHRYLRHYDSALWIAANGGPQPYDSRTLFREDATWTIAPPWAG